MVIASLGLLISHCLRIDSIAIAAEDFGLDRSDGSDWIG